MFPLRSAAAFSDTQPMIRSLLRVGLVPLVLAHPGPAFGQFTLHPDLVYKSVNNVPIHLDLYEPDASGPHALVIWIHGGGWQGGNKDVPLSRIEGLLQANIAVASINYRLTSQASLYGANEVIFPAQIDDVQDALLFLRSNAATWELDPARVGTWGTSAGGHLAALAGTMGDASDPRGDTSVQAIGDGYGPTDFFTMDMDALTFGCSTSLTHGDPNSPESKLVGFDGPGEGILVLSSMPGLPEFQLVLQANPVLFVDANDPPLLVLHGQTDCTVSIGQSHRLVDAYTALGADVTLLVHAGGHELPAEFVEDFHTFFVTELGGNASAPLFTENYTQSTRVALDEQAVPANFDNETIRQASFPWGACNMSTTLGAIPHAVQLDPNPAVSVDGGSLLFNGGALSAGSRASSRLTLPLDLTPGGQLRLRVSKANAPGGIQFRVLLRDGSGWWASAPVSTPEVANPLASATLAIELAALTWFQVDPSSPAGVDIDEVDSGGESGPLLHLGIGIPSLAAVDGIGIEMAANNDLTRMLAIDKLELSRATNSLGSVSCTSLPNSTGAMARLDAGGSALVASNDVHFFVSDLPVNQFGLLISSRGLGGVPLYDGTLCLAGPIGRHGASIGSSNASGQITYQVDLQSMPSPAPPFQTAVVPGETWHFQWWFRDTNPPFSANLSNGLSILFQ